jgi:hypothetical protein
MSLPEKFPDKFMSPKEAVESIKERYGLSISVTSLYSMINRGDSPKVTYFRNLPKFTVPDIDEWVKNNRSDKRK